jgi:hypothetical protein
MFTAPLVPGSRVVVVASFTVTFGVHYPTLWILSAMSGSEVPAA